MTTQFWAYATGVVAWVGLCIGSFLNVVIARVPEGLSIVTPRSRCPKCGHEIPWYENIPIVSWVVLRGKCSECETPISARYVVVELLTGMLFVAMVWRYGYTWSFFRSVCFLGFLIPLAVIDVEKWILPFEIVIPGAVVGVASAALLGKDAVVDSLIGVAVAFVAFRMIEFFGWLAFKKEAFGGGDKFLFAMIAAFMSWKALPAVFLLANFQGAVYGVSRILISGKANSDAADPKTEKGVEEEDPVFTMSWVFLKTGLSVWQRIKVLPYGLFLQPIPDDAPEGMEADAAVPEAEWVPGTTNIQFGPWLALSAVQLMLFADWIKDHIPLEGLHWMFDF